MVKKKIDSNPLAANEDESIPSAPISIESKNLLVKSHSKLKLINLGSIEFLKAEGSYTQLVLQRNKKLLSTKGIGYYEKILPQSIFVRCHNSFIVNIHYFVELNYSAATIMIGKHFIPFSRRRSAKLVKSISDHFCHLS